MSWASSAVMSEMKVGRGGLSLQKKWGMLELGFVQARHSSRNAFSCARCFDMRPVAVAAEAGRPA